MAVILIVKLLCLRFAGNFFRHVPLPLCFLPLLLALLSFAGDPGFLIGAQAIQAALWTLMGIAEKENFAVKGPIKARETRQPGP